MAQQELVHGRGKNEIYDFNFKSNDTGLVNDNNASDLENDDVSQLTALLMTTDS